MCLRFLAFILLLFGAKVPSLGLRLDSAFVRPDSTLHSVRRHSMASNPTDVSGEAVDVGERKTEVPAFPLLGQEAARKLDEELMGARGYTLEQLMELAGLAVALSVGEEFAVSKYPRVLIVCGPGNNGGDGLVAARHLQLFGYKPVISWPKHIKRLEFMATQAAQFDIPFLEVFPEAATLSKDYDMIVDAVFGFRFKGAVRAPFDTILSRMWASSLPTVSVDIPSGWDVEAGDISCSGFVPSMLVSLTAPKTMAKHLPATIPHYLGGRFVPPSMIDAYGLTGLPRYPGTKQVVKLS